MKPITFLGDSLDQIRSFSTDAKQGIGFQMNRVQRGNDPDDWQPMPTVGTGIKEISIKDETGAYRIIYLANLHESVYVLHAFQKKTQKTRKSDIDLAKKRLKKLLRG